MEINKNVPSDESLVWFGTWVYLILDGVFVKLSNEFEIIRSCMISKYMELYSKGK